MINETVIDVEFGFLFIYLICLFTNFFGTQACPEGMCTNGTQGLMEGATLPGSKSPTYSFRIVMWVLLRPTRTRTTTTTKFIENWKITNYITFPPANSL